MAQLVDLKISFSPKDLLVPMKILKKMDSFSRDTWDGVEDIIYSFTSHMSRRIKGNTVRPGTYSWRKGYAKKGKKVETYKVSMSSVNVSKRVGDRTGTFLDAYANLEEPGVTIWQGTPWGGKKRGYGTPIKNGAYSIEINADAFARIKNSGWGGYPNFFQHYLIKRGILPPGGFLDLPDSAKDAIMYSLEAKVERHWAQVIKEV